MAIVRKRTWKTAQGEARSGFAVDYVDSQGERQRKQFASRAEANDFRVQTEGQVRSGTYRADAARTTVAEGAELFLAHCRARMHAGERMTRRNFEVYEGYVRNYVCPDAAWHQARHAQSQRAFFTKGIASRTLAQLTVGTIAQFRDDLRAYGVSVPTTRKILAMLRVMFKYLINLDRMAVNPAREVEVLGRRGDEAKRIIPPDKDLVRALIAQAREPFMTEMIFAAATGVRAGELHALRWKHILFTRREVRIETRVDAYGIEDAPKTIAGMRSIPLGENVLAALQAWRLRSRHAEANDLVFPNRDGTYQSHDNLVRDKFDPLFTRLEHRWQQQGRNTPVERFNWHALRHFAISCWIEAGLPPKAIQTFAGHSSLQVTMDRYGHLFRSDAHAQVMDTIAAEVYAPQPERPAQPRDGQGRFGRDP